MKKLLLALSVVVSMTGCAVNSTLTYDAVMPKDGEAIVVLGVSPSNTKITLHEAIVDNGFVREKSAFEKGIGGKPLNGYVPLVVKSDTVYKMSNIILYVGDKIGGVYRACDGARTLSFKAEPGTVTYIADINFASIDGKFKTGNRKNFSAARKYIEENYPNLRGKIVDGKYEMVTPTEKCVDDSASSSVIVVPYKSKK